MALSRVLSAATFAVCLFSTEATRVLHDDQTLEPSVLQMGREEPKMVANETTGCLQPVGLPPSCGSIKLTTCFAEDALPPGAMADNKCPTTEEEKAEVLAKFTTNSEVVANGSPTMYMILGGMASGKSYAMKTLQDAGVLNHKLGEEEIDLRFDEVLMSLPIFHRAKRAERVPARLYEYCTDVLYALSKKINAYALENKFSSVAEAYTMNDSKCARTQAALDQGYNVFLTFVTGTAEAAMCRVMHRQEEEKRYAAIQDVTSSYSRAGDGSETEACFNTLQAKHEGQTITFVKCENERGQMECSKPVIHTKM